MIRFKSVKEGEREHPSKILHRQKQAYYIELGGSTAETKTIAEKVQRKNNKGRLPKVPNILIFSAHP